VKIIVGFRANLLIGQLRAEQALMGELFLYWHGPRSLISGHLAARSACAALTPNKLTIPTATAENSQAKGLLI
jgi:hypothetical protein